MENNQENGFGQQPEGGAQNQERNITPELLRQMDTRDLYTVPGGMRITEFREAIRIGNVPQLRESLEKALAWIEGVTNGVDAGNYDFDMYMEKLKSNRERRKQGLRPERIDDREIVDLKNMFESVETSTDRPETSYVRMAVEDGLEKTIERAQFYRKNKDVYIQTFIEERVGFYERLNEANERANRKTLDDDRVHDFINEETQAEKERMDSLSNSIGDLKGLRHHYDARTKVFEPLFIFTQRTCEDEDSWMQMNSRSPKPDKGHWIGFYQSNRLESAGEKESPWGRAVDRTKNAIEDIRWGKIKLRDDEGNEIKDKYGKHTGHNIYLNGFRTTGDFVSWVKALLPYTEITTTLPAKEGSTPQTVTSQRIDVLFAAWRAASSDGTISKLAWGVEPAKTVKVKDNNGDEKEEPVRDSKGNIVYKYSFGNPPFASDIRTKLIHNDKVRANEWGWPANDERGRIVDLDEKVFRDENGNIISSYEYTEQEFSDYRSYAQSHRVKDYKAISHSGHPLSIGRIGRLVDSYESKTNVTLKGFTYEDNDGQIKPLQKTENDEYSLHDLSYKYGLSRSNPDFPWSDTEIRTGSEAAGEPTSGSWGRYHLDTVRGEKIRSTMIREIPDVNKLTADFFEDSTVRFWDKLGKLKPGELRDGVPQNPFAWHLLGILRTRSRQKFTPKWMNGEIGYRSEDYQNKVTNTKEGESGQNSVSVADFLTNAMRTNCVSQSESDWIFHQIVG
ncbi:MAG: hypothetical protein UT39_C0009G0025 [Candidatus Woesebacteria bacterium GW2011_GWA1_39_21]|uniref:Uncharacterized protein n=1 Tax=Candidatus Woesebacteria bacterium GW2011_GWA1_39_21 TaxID=1618550 RepID=A0A0G0QLK7_9BACT|nr:MAG: hypothetical protein UT39_C0009G0025 [Candidatus Woesebacteria bacterium GW2011_GWA1_39_21]